MSEEDNMIVVFSVWESFGKADGEKIWDKRFVTLCTSPSTAPQKAEKLE